MASVAVKERPILFSAPMVRAILAGTKTQTRRIVGPGNSDFGSASKEFFKHCDFNDAFVDPGGTIFGPGPYLKVADHRGVDCERCKEMGWEETRHRLYPRWAVGDRLWVRETWLELDSDHWHWPGKPMDLLIDVGKPRRNACAYRADTDADGDEIRQAYGYKWKPSIHMPRWASRIDLEITDVRAQRLQEISPEDSKAEGIEQFAKDNALGGYWTTAYARLWDEINGPGAWDANPWVWAITFKRV